MHSGGEEREQRRAREEARGRTEEWKLKKKREWKQQMGRLGIKKTE